MFCLLERVTALAFVGSVLLRTAAYPGVRITIPLPANDTATKLIPDGTHPFIAPGAGDQRGPCPGLNTMANHGYIPRNGVASFQQLIAGAQEAFNLDYNFAMAVSAFGILARGNPLLGVVSIGGETPLVPPLPGSPDGMPGGFSKHGRFEGDVSLTRADAALGDNAHFQSDMYQNLLSYVQTFGEGDVVTLEAMQNYRFDRYTDSVLNNPELLVMPGRRGFGLGEAGFVLDLFKNAARDNLTTDVMSTFFEHETFPAGWHRHDGPYTFMDILDAADEISLGFSEPYGFNAPNGTFIHDTTDPRLTDSRCSVYFNLVVQNLPEVLLNTTGLLQENVNTLVNAMFPIFEPLGCTEVYQPGGPAGV